MQRLEVSGAVRPLKWPLGVKWLRTEKLGRLGTVQALQFSCHCRFRQLYTSTDRAVLIECYGFYFNVCVQLFGVYHGTLNTHSAIMNTVLQAVTRR
jgi:hypothetical protein